MANYNTFVVVDCNSKKIILTTSSARKARQELYVGRRIEVWNDNLQVKKIYQRNKEELNSYVKIEKEYIGRKQREAEQRNKARRERAMRGDDKWQK